VDEIEESLLSDNYIKNNPFPVNIPKKREDRPLGGVSR